MNSLHANECQVTFYSVKSFSFKLYIRKKREIERRKTINILFQNGWGGFGCWVKSKWFDFHVNIKIVRFLTESVFIKEVQRRHCNDLMTLTVKTNIVQQHGENCCTCHSQRLQKGIYYCNHKMTQKPQHTKMNLIVVPFLALLIQGIYIKEW